MVVLATTVRNGALAGAGVAAAGLLSMMLLDVYLSKYLGLNLLLALILLIVAACGAVIGAIVGWATWQTYSRPTSWALGRAVLVVATLSGVYGLWNWTYGLAQLGNVRGMAMCFLWSVAAASLSFAEGRRIARASHAGRAKKLS